MLVNDKNAQIYFNSITKRMREHKFRVKPNVEYNGRKFLFVATQTKLNYIVFVTNFFIFSRFVTPNIDMLKHFSASAFRYTKKATIIPPLGIFYAHRCFPVAVVDSISAETSKFVLNSTAPIHWGGPELLVVFSIEEQKLYFGEQSLQPGVETIDDVLNRQTICETLSP
jgi:hypothetical protein